MGFFFALLKENKELNSEHAKVLLMSAMNSLFTDTPTTRGS